MALEPLVGQTIDGTHAYTEKTIARGDTIHVRVSSTTAYQISIARLGPDPDSPAQDTELFDFDGQDFGPQTQPIHPGSYINIEPGLDPTAVITALTLECWVRLWPWPTAVARTERGVVSQHSFPDKCGLGLFLDSNNQLVFYAGSGTSFDPTRLFPSTHLLTDSRWHHVAAVCDSVAGFIKLYLDGNEQTVSSTPGITVTPGPAPLRIGAYGENGMTGHLLDADIALPVIYNRALTLVEITFRFNDKGQTIPDVSDVLGCWPLDEEGDTSVHDISSFERVGTIINNGSWMIVVLPLTQLLWMITMIPALIPSAGTD